MVYVLLSNLGPVGENEAAAAPARVPSEIVDYLGKPLATASDGGEGFITAVVDIDALRKARTAPSAQNWLSEIQAPLHLGSYQSAQFFPMDGFAEAPMQSAKDYEPIKARVIADLVARGVLKAPGA
jgi:hypothetical protein